MTGGQKTIDCWLFHRRACPCGPSASSQGTLVANCLFMQRLAHGKGLRMRIDSDRVAAYAPSLCAVGTDSLTGNSAQSPARRPTDEHRGVVALAACVSTNPKYLGLGAHLVGPWDRVGRCTRVPDNVSNQSVSEQMNMALINCKHQAVNTTINESPKPKPKVGACALCFQRGRTESTGRVNIALSCCLRTLHTNTVRMSQRH
jgi:hypothetical protein